LRYRRRFAGASRRLASALPEDPLRSDALVAVLALYLHEPAKERAGIEDEYRNRREEFLVWREEAQRLGSPQELETSDLRSWLEEAERLDSRLSALETYVADIQGRAEGAEGLPHEALERLTRAGDAIGAAATACEAVSDPRSAQALNEALAVAQARYREAWTAVDKGKERPLTAIHLADEAADLAADVQRRAVRITTLPGEIEEQLRDLDTSIEKLGADLEYVREEFETAAASYAPSSWHEIGGFGRAAKRDLERARQLHESAARLAQSDDPAQLERAEQRLGRPSWPWTTRRGSEKRSSGISRSWRRPPSRPARSCFRPNRTWTRHWPPSRNAMVQGVRTSFSGGRPILLNARAMAFRVRSRIGSRSSSSQAAAPSSPARQLGHPRERSWAWPRCAWPSRTQRRGPRSRATRPGARQSSSRQQRTARRPSSGRPKNSYRAALSLEAALGETPDEGSLEAVAAAFEEAERMAVGFLRAAKSVEVDGAKPDVGQDARPAHALVWSLDLSRTARTQ
jgi:hypothetical protein